MFKTFISGIGLVALVLGIVWLAQGNEFFMYKVFNPQYEAVRRDTMIQSRAYSEAMNRRFYDLKLQYQQATDDQVKATIRALIQHEVGAVDRSRLPSDIQSFLNSLGV